MLTEIRKLFNLENYKMTEVDSHEGGRNWVFLCSSEGEYRYVIRISLTGDRLEEEYLAETEFVHYLAQNGAAVTDVFPSVNGKFVEKIVFEGREGFVSCFAYAKGMLISDNGYRYRDGAPLSEYFYNTGKTLGKIHRLAKSYIPGHKRSDYFDKYNMQYINALIPDSYAELKAAIERRLKTFKELPQEDDVYGLVHFDFIDMVLIENIVDEFECCKRAGEPLDYEDIEDAAECLLHNIPYAGLLRQI